MRINLLLNIKVIDNYSYLASIEMIRGSFKPFRRDAYNQHHRGGVVLKGPSFINSVLEI